MRRTWSVVPLVLLSVLAGCGGGSSKVTAPATTTTTRPTVETDKARATRALLSAVDLPGYEEGTSDDSPDPIKSSIDACLGNDPLLTGDDKTDPRHAVGKEFDQDTKFVNSQAVVAQTEEQARASVAKFRAPEVPSCFSKAIGTSKDPVFRNTTVAPLPSIAAGDETFALRVSTTLVASGRSTKVAIDYQLARRDRALAMLIVGGTPFPDADRAALVQKMVDRLAP